LAGDRGAGSKYLPISATSPTLQIARQRIQAEPAVARVLPVALPRARRILAAGAIALAVTISWLAAISLVIGLAWAASAASSTPPAETPYETLPYAVAWSAGSLAAIAASVGSLFAGGARSVTLLALAAVLGMALAAVAVGANVVAG
jgi:hypothetical protein